MMIIKKFPNSKLEIWKEFLISAIYSKGYTTNWNRDRELFKIHEINTTNPVTYGVEDGNNELLE